MVKVSIFRDSQGFIWEYVVEGHAGAEKSGKDIVCAAVSAVAYTGLNALQEMAGIESYTLRDGYIRCTVPKDIPEDKKQLVKTILNTIAYGFKQIEFTPEYRKYISVLDEEV